MAFVSFGLCKAYYGIYFSQKSNFTAAAVIPRVESPDKTLLSTQLFLAPNRLDLLCLRDFLLDLDLLCLGIY